MEVYLTKIGEREFLIAGHACIPVDDIKYIELKTYSGGCDNSVRIDTKNGEEHYYAYGNADAVREYLADNRIGDLLRR